MLPETIPAAWEAFKLNRILGAGLDESDLSKVRFQELVFRLAYHAAVGTELFQELEVSLGPERP